MQIIRRSNYTAIPWKNGGGLTHEATRVPAEGAAFRWRVSLAQVDVSGPFSDFAGYRRTMVLLRGAGVRLAFADGSETVLRDVGSWTNFDGAVSTHCELLAGGCVDLNLMVSNDLPPASVTVESVRAPLVCATLGGRQSVGNTLLILPIDGALTIQDGVAAERRVEAWDLLLLSCDEAQSLRVAPVGLGGPDASATTLTFVAIVDDESRATDVGR